MLHSTAAISGGVDRAPATPTVDSGSIPGRVKQKTIQIGFSQLPCLAFNIKCDSVKPSPCVVTGAGKVAA